MLGTENLGLFIYAGLLLNATPGPDTLYILGRTASQGRRAGVASVLGISTGCLCHSLASAFGLSAILATSATVFAWVKMAGAAYLVYLGLGLLFSRSPRAATETMAIARNEDGPLKTADEVEELLLEEMRQLGNDTTCHWASQAEERVSRELKEQDPTVLSRKKNVEVVVCLWAGECAGTDLVQSGQALPPPVAQAAGSHSAWTKPTAPTSADRLRLRAFLCTGGPERQRALWV